MRPLPKSLQLSEMLIREIASGKLPDGARLPPEREMAAMHDVAVGTLRKALEVLDAKGLLKRVQGSGNYIQARPDIDSVYTFFRLERIGGGGLPTAQLLGTAKRARPIEAKAFQSRVGHRIRRLRFLDDIPIALEEIWLDAHYVAELNADALSESLYYYYKRALGLVIASAEDWVSVAEVPDWAPRTFGLRPNSMCGFIQRLGTAQSGKIAEYSRTWFDPATANYVMRLR